MYGWIWRRLPGNRIVKTIICLAAFAAIVAVLFTWVFPAVTPLLPIDELSGV